jgi:tetratricopeptide (TPR) repeat protein
MTGNKRNPFHLWEELKQRKVVRVITVYAASAFAILQAADMIFPRLGLPSWTISLVMILLGCGLVVAVILSWIYDFTPEGIKKTSGRELRELESGEQEDIGTSLPASGLSGTDEGNFQVQRELYIRKIEKYKKKERIYSFSSVTVILLVIALFLFSGGSTIPFEKHNWVVISDFENLTEDPVFDKSLYTAFTLTVNQSRHINVFSRNRMIETLQRMKTSYLGYIDEKTGREIAVREGINILISPSISEVGKRFVITSKIIESKTGNLLRSIVLNSEGKDDILSKLDRMSRNLRRDLGESRYRIAMQDKPLSKVTTSSLEALKQYSLGIESHYKLNFTAARSYYENALKIDTGFVAAKASLGNILYEKFDTVEGKKLLSKAVRSVENLTIKEKYGILSFYAINVEHNLQKGIENTKILTGLYPDDPAYHHNLGWFYQIAGRYENALKEYKTAVIINPSQALSYGGILWIYLEKLGMADSALVWSRKMITDNPQNSWAYFYAGSSYVCLDSLEMALVSFLKAREINPYFEYNQARLAQTYNLMGRYREALLILEKIHETNKNDIQVYYDIGVNYQDMGNTGEAMKYYKLYEQKGSEKWLKENPDLAETYINLGIVAARLNENVSSQKLLEKALLIDTTLHDRYAEIYCRQGNISKATRQIEKALEKGYRDLYSLKASPDLRQLQTDVRFRELLQKYF